jgi:hypothetical protein
LRQCLRRRADPHRSGSSGRLRGWLTRTRLLSWSSEREHSDEDYDEQSESGQNADLESTLAAQGRPHLLCVNPHGDLLLSTRRLGTSVRGLRRRTGKASDRIGFPRMTLVSGAQPTSAQCALTEGLSRRESDENCTPGMITGEKSLLRVLTLPQKRPPCNDGYKPIRPVGQPRAFGKPHGHL